jgi:hypothetical protein
MSAITDFRDRLQAGGLTFTNGGAALIQAVNLFVGLFPVEPDDAVLIARFPGPGPERVMGEAQGGVVYHSTHVQITVRSKSYVVGEQMMKDIIWRMDNFVGLIGANDYLWISQRMGISDYGHDENRRFRFMTTFMMRGPIP